MSFWDSSALVPLLVAQEKSKVLEKLAKASVTMHVWWGSSVECTSAICRLEREGAITSDQSVLAFNRLHELADSFNEVSAQQAVRRTAVRLLRTHPLRAADALQLAAAIQAAEGRPETLDFVCLDSRLCEAAEREGFRVVGIKM